MPDKVRPEKVRPATSSDEADAPREALGTRDADATGAGRATKGAASSHAAARPDPAPAKVKRVDVGDRSWVPWVFVPVGLIGVAWLVVYYIVGDFMPGISGGWNILVGMGCMAAAFAIATLWK